MKVGHFLVLPQTPYDPTHSDPKLIDYARLALNEDGTFRESVWYNTIGEAFLPIAFRAAAEADPGAKLFYNDFDMEYNDNKTAGGNGIVELIKSYGVRIDGVGFQAHLASEITSTAPRTVPSKKTLIKALKSFTKLDVDVAYTEVDIRMKLPATEQKLKVQAKDWANVVGSCMDVERCVGVTVWVSKHLLLTLIPSPFRFQLLQIICMTESWHLIRVSRINIIGFLLSSLEKVMPRCGMRISTRSRDTKRSWTLLESLKGQ